MGKRKDENGSYWVNMRAYEKGLLEWALEVCADSPTRAAEMLGINASYLYERCKITGVERPTKPPRPAEKAIADATPTPRQRLKIVRDPVEDVTEDEEATDEVAAETDAEDSEVAEDSEDTETEEDAVEEDGDEEGEEEGEEGDDEYVEEEVPDDECLCGAKLMTEDERTKWIECTNCRTNRLTNAAGAKPAVMLDDDEEEAG